MPFLRAQRTVHAALLFLLGLAALTRWSRQLWRLAFGDIPSAAYDLHLRWVEVTDWFSGIPVYSIYKDAVYPPATYLLLWPAFGWMSFESARLWWPCVCVASVSVITVLLLRPDILGKHWARGLVVLFPWAHYASAVSVGVGQLTLPSLAASFTGLVLLVERRPTWGRDLAVALCFTFSLVKPSLTVPLLLGGFLLSAKSMRALILTAGFYGTASFLALLPQKAGILEILSDWISRSSALAPQEGYLHIGEWLAAVGWEAAITPASLLLLAAFGWWGARMRRTIDPWVLLGVAGIVARLWTYHRFYDDLLILLPLVALVRLDTDTAPLGQRLLTRFLGLGILLSGLMRTTWHQGGEPAATLFDGWQLVVHLAVLAFLILHSEGVLRRHEVDSVFDASESSDHGAIRAYGEARARCGWRPRRRTATRR